MVDSYFSEEHRKAGRLSWLIYELITLDIGDLNFNNTLSQPFNIELPDTTYRQNELLTPNHHGFELLASARSCGAGSEPRTIHRKKKKDSARGHWLPLRRGRSPLMMKFILSRSFSSNHIQSLPFPSHPQTISSINPPFTNSPLALEWNGSRLQFPITLLSARCQR